MPDSVVNCGWNKDVQERGFYNMLSLIEVTCPHCSAQGKIMVPPVGSVIIGPCPKCNELVVIFCGQALALDRVIMESESMEDRREHLLAVLNEFLRERITGILAEENGMADVTPVDEGEIGDFIADEEVADIESTGNDDSEQVISQNEVDQFTEVDLKLLDNRAYFKSVFGDA